MGRYIRRSFWELKENTIEESKKYSSRTEFNKKSKSAYDAAKRHGWLDEMTWLRNRNVYRDKVDYVYRYYFPDEGAVYVGRTIRPSKRHREHNTRENDTVFRFAFERGLQIPKMEILESGLTVTEGADKERYWHDYYKGQGFLLLNKQPCGSLGYMSRGKWPKHKCIAESKKYKTRSEFQRNASHAYQISVKNGWIDEMTWLPKNNSKPHGYWNEQTIFDEARKYDNLKDFHLNSRGAFSAARRLGLIPKLSWLKKAERLPNGYWKVKEHCIEEATKYTSKKQFQDKNQSAYWASLKYGYLDDMPWLVKNKVSKRGSFKNNKDAIMEESKKYSTRGEFQRKNKSAYSAALKYKWLDEMTWLKVTKHNKQK